MKEVLLEKQCKKQIPSISYFKKSTELATSESTDYYSFPLLGFKRIAYDSSSFQNYIRYQSLKKYGAKVINYDGQPYFYQLGHVGVLDVDVPKNGLQQCADALIRLRSEYLWSINQKNKIGFEFTSGHYCSWKKYAEGYRPKINGNKVTFHKTASVDNSKANFYKYQQLWVGARRK